MKLDILFIHTNASKKIYQDLSKHHSAIEPPTWALLLAQSTRTFGFKVTIIDANAENLSEIDIYKRILNQSPKLICFVAYGQNVNAGTTNMTGVIDVASYLKDKKINFVSIDVEGFELNVLKGFDLNKYKPDLVIIEFIDLKIKEYYFRNIDNILNSHVYAFMDQNNYKMVNWIHDDLVFVPKGSE